MDRLDPDARSEACELLHGLQRDRHQIEQHERTLAESQAEALVNAGIMMSELEEAHVQLDIARKAAEEASRAKSEFLANMSHEIRTPMNGVIGLLQLALEQELRDTQRTRLETAFRSAQSLLKLLNDILEFSKLEAGQLELERRAFSLLEVVEDVAALFAPICSGKGLVLNCHVDPALSGRYVGDSHRITQVLTNLVGNAVKFTGTGQVTLRVGRTVHTDRRETLRIDVIDTGIGIPAASRSQLFRPFSQLDASMSRRFGGTGLGLAISSRLTELMQGKLSVESVVGQGSCFTLEVGLERDGQESIQSGAGRPFEGMRAWVVAQAGGLQDTLRVYGESLGLAVECMEPARLEGVDAAKVDVIVVAQPGAEAGGFLDMARLASVPVIRLACDGGVHETAAASASTEPVVDVPVRYLRLRDAIRQALRPGTGEGGSGTPGAAAACESFPGKRILLVEDNEINQMLAMAMLESYGAAVECAGNGREALERRERTTYDLVFMDCQMPVMNGFDATREWRDLEAAESSARVPIIALTANAMAGDRETCIEAGMDDYLAKPFLRADLTRMLSTWLASPTEPVPAAKVAHSLRS